MGSSSLVKSRKLNQAFRFPPVFGLCNSKMLLVKFWDRIRFEKFMIIKVTKKNFYYHIPFLLTMFSQNVTSDFFCNNTFDVKRQNPHTLAALLCTHQNLNFLEINRTILLMSKPLTGKLYTHVKQR